MKELNVQGWFVNCELQVLCCEKGLGWSRLFDDPNLALDRRLIKWVIAHGHRLVDKKTGLRRSNEYSVSFSDLCSYAKELGYGELDGDYLLYNTNDTAIFKIYEVPAGAAYKIHKTKDHNMCEWVENLSMTDWVFCAR